MQLQCNACLRVRMGIIRERLGKSHSHKWRQENPEKRRAHKMVENALIRGALAKQPCERCQTNYRVQAHHDDYSKPLDVMWLCQRHHKERHRELSVCEEIAATA